MACSFCHTGQVPGKELLARVTCLVSSMLVTLSAAPAQHGAVLPVLATIITRMPIGNNDHALLNPHARWQILVPETVNRVLLCKLLSKSYGTFADSSQGNK